MIDAIINVGVTSPPIFDLLQARLDQGFYIKKQDDRYWLFNPDGEGYCSGITLKSMMVNLIFTDC